MKKLLKKPLIWIVMVVLGVLGSWFQGIFNQFLPSPSRTWLAINNTLTPSHQVPGERFRFVLCWLRDDEQGENTQIVADTFQVLEGIDLKRSAQVVKAEGAADKWRPLMQRKAREVLKGWQGDVAIVGQVDKEALSLWFVPRAGEGELGLGNDLHYPLEQGKLRGRFREHLVAELTAMALTAVAPLADNEVRGGTIEAGLRRVEEQLAWLLAGGLIKDPSRWAVLQSTYGTVLSSLGEREGGTERLEQAVVAHIAALQEWTRERIPLNWAMVQNNLGNVLLRLGGRERGIERLEAAVAAYGRCSRRIHRRGYSALLG